MQKPVLRAFQVIEKDGVHMVSSTYNVIDSETGEPVKQNVKDSFYAMDSDLAGHIDAVIEYITNRLESK